MKVYSLLLSIVLSCCSAEDPPGPLSIRLNANVLLNQTEVVLTAGSAFTLSCHGNGAVRWSSTAFRLLYQDRLPDPVEVRRSDPRHTGTYHCGYTNQSLKHLDTWIHLYIKDPADPSSVFVTPRSTPDVKEGQDFLFRCLLTDPSITNLTLQSEGSAGGRGRDLPQDMNVTFDPQRGALIRDLRKSFTGRYVCSGWKDGRQFRSRPVDLLVVPRLHHPPSLSVSQDDLVRLEGEKFELTCLTSNPSHFYNVTWTHLNKKTLNVTVSSHYSNGRLYINSTLTVSAVSLTHSGPYTCTAVNEAGVATATAQLRVLDGPYLRIYLQPMQPANANTKTIEVNWDRLANISRMPIELQDELEANISSSSLEVNGELIANVSTNGMGGNGTSTANISGSSTVVVHEDQDVMLTFVTEAYPPIRNQRWTTPTHVNNGNNNMVYQESYAANGYRSEASLLLRQVGQKDRGRYSFHFSNSFFSGSQNIDLRIYRAPSAVISVENDTLTCSSFGYPLPTILWYTCPGVQDTCGNVSTYQVSPADVTSQEQEEEEVRKHLTLPLSLGDDVTVECVTYNHMGVSREVFNPRKPQTFFTPALIGALSTAAVLLLLLLVVFYKWRQKPKYEIRWKIIESTDGNNYTFVDPTQLPYNYKWEFPRDKLRLGAVLGSGAFGKVVEATAYGLGTDNNVTRVAVKMLKPSAHSEEREALMSELKILSHLGYHNNIVNLLGACTRGGPMLMITEYCSHGDLLNFLRAHTQDFMVSILSVDEVEGEAFYKNMAAQHARLRSDSGISCCSEYQEMQPVLSPGQTHLGLQTDSLSIGDLMRFSHQVAQGLDFLSSRNCIHRDVAARNVLLTDRRVAKICDFGLARDIRNDDSYIVQGNARLPVKWMAPESIFQCVYTVQSDVWSYGVLLWEIFSLGKSPYPNVAVDTNFYKMIKDGRHMDQPDFAPAEMYQLMTLCWSLEPTDRPTFKLIGQLINRLLPSTNDSSRHHSDQSYRNIDECREEEEEEEEVRGGDTLKREEEERSQRERHDDDDEEEEEPMMKNIYQLS
ncbi:macrophage colony-stimulating factor 1 receptor 2 isoform X2 [Siniperca chuatsi]|uniref:macrophage colony-stimulating factor 1 receptor 2 isoform X2 n=1 Tax=Siniperca chuatsi TaxID=119488 RepID=UPI001CE06636|nr:macrophage colony-stimulating factor 1 receptor 2 isoform X2 [Siniperca chuatsi]